MNERENNNSEIPADPSKKRADVDMNREAEEKNGKHFTSIVNSGFRESEEEEEYTEPPSKDEPTVPLPPVPEPEKVADEADLDLEGMSRQELTAKLDSVKKMLNEGLISAEEFETYKKEITKLL